MGLAQGEHITCLRENVHRVQTQTQQSALCYFPINVNAESMLIAHRTGGGNPVACHMGICTPCWLQENVKAVQLAKVSHDELHSRWLSNSRPFQVPWMWYPQLLSSKLIKDALEPKLSIKFKPSFALLLTLFWDGWIIGFDFGSSVSMMT